LLPETLPDHLALHFDGELTSRVKTLAETEPNYTTSGGKPRCGICGIVSAKVDLEHQVRLRG
jgi:hypothetical protein